MKPILVPAVLSAALAFAAAAPAHAQQCDVFTDVQASDPFCASVQWLKNRGITTGCTATQYCPADPVTRAQMALFLNRLGTATLPRVFWTTSNNAPPVELPQAGGGTDYCTTAPIPAAPHPRIAVAQGYMSLQANGGDNLQMGLRYTPSGQAPVYANFVSQTVRNPAGTYQLAWASNPAALAPGVSHTFAIRLSNTGQAGSTFLGDNQCQLIVMVLNDNPSTPPLDAP
ncbi:MAG: S-layer homology domain-containing protein [Burkholderiales bacterium]|nr:S-layer homology domain-containing protein [Burkholderiales bacterium]